MFIKKIKYIRFILIIILTFGSGLSSVCFGQEPAILSVTDSIQKDKSKVNVEKVPSGKIEKFRTSKDFIYTHKELERIDLMSYFWYWLNKIIEAIFSDKGAAPYLRILVLVLFLTFIIYKIFGSKLSGVFSINKKTKKANEFEYFDEDINTPDLDKKLNRAIAEKNYKDAIRYYYLILLKRLDECELIQWKMSKTNRDYQNELSNNQILNDFIILSGIYEYTWYGNFAVDSQHFNNWQEDFQSAIKLIN